MNAPNRVCPCIALSGVKRKIKHHHHHRRLSFGEGFFSLFLCLMAYRTAPSMINEVGVWKGSHARWCNESKRKQERRKSDGRRCTAIRSKLVSFLLWWGRCFGLTMQSFRIVQGEAIVNGGIQSFLLFFFFYTTRKSGTAAQGEMEKSDQFFSYSQSVCWSLFDYWSQQGLVRFRPAKEVLSGLKLCREVMVNELLRRRYCWRNGWSNH